MHLENAIERKRQDPDETDDEEMESDPDQQEFQNDPSLSQQVDIDMTERENAENAQTTENFMQSQSHITGGAAPQSSLLTKRNTTSSANSPSATQQPQPKKRRLMEKSTTGRIAKHVLFNPTPEFL